MEKGKILFKVSFILHLLKFALLHTFWIQTCGCLCLKLRLHCITGTTWKLREYSQRALHTEFYFCQEINWRFRTISEEGAVLNIHTVLQDCIHGFTEKYLFSPPLSVVNFPLLLLHYLHISIRNISFASLTSEWQPATKLLLDNVFLYLISPSNTLNCSVSTFFLS